MAVLPNSRQTLNAGVAQLVERYLAKVQVDGSSPFTRSNFEARWQSGYAAACKAVYAGSIPTLASNSVVVPPLTATGLVKIFKPVF